MNGHAMHWIMSYGGPLICLEWLHMPAWCGIYGLSTNDPEEASDYDRACRDGPPVASIALREGTALLVGIGSLDTAVWASPSGITHLICVECAEPDIDEASYLAMMNDDIFECPMATTDIAFSSPRLCVFDAADSGSELHDRYFEFSVCPGRYRVLTQIFTPDEDIVSFLVHRFVRVEDVGV